MGTVQKRSCQVSSIRIRRRAGFTLLELLVVIAILALLMALGAAASMRVMSEQVQKSTEESLQKIQTVLNHQWAAAVDTARKEAYPRQPVDVEKVLMSMAGNDARLARVIYVKLRLMQEFPQSFQEVTRAGQLGLAKQSYVKYLSAGNKTLPPYRDPTIYGTDGTAEPNSMQWHECSACLYMALKEARHGMDAHLDTTLSGREVTDQYVGFKEILDFWGNPVVFCRYPTGSTSLNPNGAQPMVKVGWQDSLDPEGLLAGVGGAFATWCHETPPKGASFKLMPLVYSAGRNMRYGVNLLSLKPTGNPKYEYDNVYSNDVRMLGHGN